MNERDNVLIILVIIIVVFLPFGVLFATYSAEPFYVVNGEPLREAAQSAGITVVNTTITKWPFPGATGGKTYVLQDKEGNTLTVMTQTFDNAGSRDAAMQTYQAQSVGKGKPIGTMFVVGNLLVYIPPDPNGLQQNLLPELQKKRIS